MWRVLVHVVREIETMDVKEIRRKADGVIADLEFLSLSYIPDLAN